MSNPKLRRDYVPANLAGILPGPVHFKAREWVIDVPRPYSERAQIKGGPTNADRNRLAVYVTKTLADGTIEAYGRGYNFLGIIPRPAMLILESQGHVEERWEGWTGGRTQEPGLMLCWLTGERVPA